MQGDDKRSDLFLGQGSSGTWDTRPGSEPRDAGSMSAWPTGSAAAALAQQQQQQRGEDLVWGSGGEEASVIHRSSSLGGQCASTGSSNSQPGSRHSRGAATSSNSSWPPSNESTSEGADQLLGAVGGSEESQPSSQQQQPPQRNCRPPRLGLLGGGESSLNNGSTAAPTGWGAPPPGPQGGWGGSAAAQWGGGGTATRGAEYAPGGSNPGGDATGSPTKPAAAGGGWGAGAASKGAEAADPKGSSSSSSGGMSRSVMEEQPISELRRLAAFSEGWGQTAINQEAPWELPPSPGTKDPPTGPPWRAPVNNGTEIWENNLRSSRAGGNKQPNPGGPQAAQGSGQCSQQQPWGSHTPTSHIGGTWGEEDEAPPSNMWTGVPPPAQQGGGPRPPPEGPPSWGGDHHRGGGGDKHWGAPAPPPNCGWGGPEEREPQGGGRLWGGGRPSHGMDDGSWGPKAGGPPPGVGTWSPVGGPNGKREPSGWEEPSPPPSRRPVTNYDDGTAVWGNPTRQGKVSHWKDMPSVKSISGGGGAPPGMLRMPKDGVWGGSKGPRGGGANWCEPNWDEQHGKGGWGNGPPDQAYWGSKPKGPPSWADGQIDTSTWGGPSKQGGKPLTKDLIYASKQFRLLSEMGFKKEDVENALRCNQMNLEDTLMDLQAITRGAGNQDGGGLLDGSDCGLGGRPKMRPDEDPHGPLGGGDAPFAGFHGGFQGLPVFGAGYGAGGGGAQGFKPPPIKGSNQGSNAPASLLNSTGMGGQNSSLTVGNSISSLSPALVQKILQQQQQQQQQHFPGNAGGPAGMGTRLGQPNVPSATQLRLLVQQIQMAVQAGHLNPQILNQPLAPQTLQLLYQLLQQIKVLHALQQQQQLVHAKGGPPLQLNVQLTQTKQRILNLQNQIAAQQALFLKQQLPPPPPQQQPPPPHAQPPPQPVPPQDFLVGGKPGGDGLHSDFRDLSLKEAVSQQQQQQSRLNQWKLPSSLDDEGKAPPSQQQNGGDFSRAPGPASKAPGLPSFLGGADSGPWSSGGGARTQDGWPDAPPPTSSAAGGTSSPGEGKDSTAGYNLTDLVAEFEPGKPWKGASALKSAEDDPHLTPGSVVRSPLSVNTIKDSELFGSWKQSPPGGEGSLVASLASLTSSTWAFTPAMHGSGNGSGGSSSSKNNVPASGWGGGSEQQAPNSDPWSVGPKTRGPPPGLASGWEQPGGSCTFLVLKNLTPQIDGSTLKTLCMQHGPLQRFHLFLKHGLALAQYSSREEAAKAQSALHNCVLSNTTMLAYIPSEAEVAQFLQLANGQGTQHQQPPPHPMPSWGGGGGAFHQQRPPLQYAPGRPAKPAEPWNTAVPSSSAVSSSSNASHLWSFPGAGGGLWAAPQTSQAGGGSNPGGLDHDHGAPGGPQSSLNSFLPGDLLSGESM
ncbi:trinucleotide repeat containing adaptor protein gawky isoform X2 [Haemaphysalis longicornis]